MAKLKLEALMTIQTLAARRMAIERDLHCHLYHRHARDADKIGQGRLWRPHDPVYEIAPGTSHAAHSNSDLRLLRKNAISLSNGMRFTRS